MNFRGYFSISNTGPRPVVCIQALRMLRELNLPAVGFKCTGLGCFWLNFVWFQEASCISYLSDSPRGNSQKIAHGCSTESRFPIGELPASAQGSEIVKTHIRTYVRACSHAVSKFVRGPRFVLKSRSRVWRIRWTQTSFEPAQCRRTIYSGPFPIIIEERSWFPQAC